VQLLEREDAIAVVVLDLGERVGLIIEGREEGLGVPGLGSLEAYLLVDGLGPLYERGKAVGKRSGIAHEAHDVR